MDAELASIVRFLVMFGVLPIVYFGLWTGYRIVISKYPER